MARKYRCYQIDSFTKEKFSGNPAGVVTNADGLAEEEMQKIAREFNNSETAFIFSSQNDAYDVEVRFFTPTREVPICGHATIAAHYARAVENGMETSRVYQKTGAGILPVDILKEKDGYRIVMTQGKIEYGKVLEGEIQDRIAAALNVRREDLLGDWPVQIVSTGHSKVMIGMKSMELLNGLQPDYGALAGISREIECNGYYVFTLDRDGEFLVRGRMFAPAIGIAEDPVTGNANGPLGAYLAHHKKVDCKGSEFTFKAKQGEAIRRPGVIEVRVDTENGEPREVKISGSATIVFQSEISLD